MFVRYLPLFVSLIMICPFSEGCSSIVLGSTPIRGGTIVKAPERALPATATKHLQRFPPVDYADIGDFNPEKKNLLVVSYPLQHISQWVSYHTPNIVDVDCFFLFLLFNITSQKRDGT